jgi:hypothetical protein
VIGNYECYRTIATAINIISDRQVLFLLFFTSLRPFSDL